MRTALLSGLLATGCAANENAPPRSGVERPVRLGETTIEEAGGPTLPFVGGPALQARPAEALGRPQGVLISPDGALLVVADTRWESFGCSAHERTTLHVYDASSGAARLVLPSVDAVAGWAFVDRALLAVDLEKASASSPTSGAADALIDLDCGLVSVVAAQQVDRLEAPRPWARDAAGRREARVVDGHVLLRDLGAREAPATIGAPGAATLDARVLDGERGVVVAACWPSGELGIWDLTLSRPVSLSPPSGRVASFTIEGDGAGRAPGTTHRAEPGDLGAAGARAPDGADRPRRRGPRRAGDAIHEPRRGARRVLRRTVFVDRVEVEVVAPDEPGTIVVFDGGNYEVLGGERTPSVAECRRGAIVEPALACAGLAEEDLLARRIGRRAALCRAPGG